MKLLHTTLPLILGAALAATTVSVQAQGTAIGAPTKVEIEVGEPVPELITTPEYEYSGAVKKKTPKSREWLEIEIPFKTKSDSAIQMVDQLTFVYYVAISQGSVNTLLSDQVIYTNIPDKDEMYAAVYVSPAALARMVGGFGKFDKGNIRKVGVEVLFKGRAIYPEPSRAWWTAAGMPAAQTGVLMAKEKTPFSMLWVDRHVQSSQP